MMEKIEYVSPEKHMLNVTVESLMQHVSVPIGDDLDDDTDKTQRYEGWGDDDWSFDWSE